MAAKVSGRLAERYESAKQISQNSELRKTLSMVPGIDKLLKMPGKAKSKKKK